jgi:hypothetical protein
MRRCGVLLALVLASALAVHDAATQTCLGLPSFHSGRIQLAAHGSFGEDARSFEGSFSLGTNKVFGGLSLGAVDYDQIAGSTLLIGGGVGYQLPLGASSSFHVCPGIRASVGFGPDDIFGGVSDSAGVRQDPHPGDDASTFAFVAGLSLGASLGSPRVRLNPTAGLGLAYSSFDLKDPGGSGAERSDTYGALDFAVGVIFRSTFSVRPAVTIPLGLEGADPVFGVTLAINVGAGAR